MWNEVAISQSLHEILPRLLADDVRSFVCRSDVLLPLTVYLLTINEHDFEPKARKQLTGQGVPEPTEDAVILRAFSLADAEFDRGSVTKAGESLSRALEFRRSYGPTNS